MGELATKKCCLTNNNKEFRGCTNNNMTYVGLERLVSLIAWGCSFPAWVDVQWFSMENRKPLVIVVSSFCCIEMQQEGPAEIPFNQVWNYGLEPLKNWILRNKNAAEKGWRLRFIFPVWPLMTTGIIIIIIVKNTPAHVHELYSCWYNMLVYSEYMSWYDTFGLHTGPLSVTLS